MSTTMARASTPIDPAADAAALLRRLGFAALMLALPVVALVARRNTVVLVPVGVGLLVIAALLDGTYRPLRGSLRDLAISRAGLAGGLLLAWCGLSLFWTPFQDSASGRFLSLVATLGVGVAGYLALPDRMRVANLYLLPIGTGVAAVVGILLCLFGGFGPGTDESQTLARGLVIVVLLLWPSVAWLRSRRRNREAIALAVAVAVAAALGPELLPLVGLGVGAAVYGLTTYNLPLGVRATAFAMSGLLTLAPLIPFIARPIASALLERSDPIWIANALWQRIITREPFHLITGHGFEAALRSRLAGLLPPQAPGTLLFEAWFDLGVIGAFAGAAALFYSTTGAGREDRPLVPAAMAAFAAVFTFACLGVAMTQMWWFTALVALAVIFVAAERGQFRTTRPKASFSRPASR